VNDAFGWPAWLILTRCLEANDSPETNTDSLCDTDTGSPPSNETVNSYGTTLAVSFAKDLAPAVATGTEAIHTEPLSAAAALRASEEMISPIATGLNMLSNTQIQRHRKCGAMIEIRQLVSRPLCGVRCVIVGNFDMRRTRIAMNLMIAKSYAEADKETSRLPSYLLCFAKIS
jgi:hypothetical protein